MANDFGRIIGVGSGRRVKRQFEGLNVAHPHVAPQRVCVDSWRRPQNTYRIPGFILEFAVHSLCIQYSNSAGSVPTFNITKCEPGQETGRHGRAVSFARRAGIQTAEAAITPWIGSVSQQLCDVHLCPQGLATIAERIDSTTARD